MGGLPIQGAAFPVAPVYASGTDHPAQYPFCTEKSDSGYSSVVVR
jgi:hypothetical protein